MTHGTALTDSFQTFTDDSFFAELPVLALFEVHWGAESVEDGMTTVYVKTTDRDVMPIGGFALDNAGFRGYASSYAVMLSKWSWNAAPQIRRIAAAS